MAISRVKALLIDDSPDKLRTLKRQLERNNDPAFSVTTFTNAYKAFDYLTRKPGTVEFVFIDHMIASDRPARRSKELPTLAGGLDFVRAINRKWPQIGIILYSGDKHTTEQDEWEGLAAGAHRYVRIEPPARLLKVATKEFISEIRELRELQLTLKEFHETLRRTDVLRRSVRVGIDLIDRRFKVWYRNDDFDTISKASGNSNQFCCACFHDRPWPPCRGCLVVDGLRVTRTEWESRHRRLARIFYSPILVSRQWKFKYLHVWAEPVYGKGKAERPIAVVESVIDLTDSATIEQMALEEHLDILLRAITELICDWLDPKRVPICKDGLWDMSSEQDRRQGYTRVRVYRADTDGRQAIIRMKRSSHDHDPDVNDIMFPLKQWPVRPEGLGPGARAVQVSNAEDDLDAMVVDQTIGYTEPPLEFLLFDDHEWIGWLAIDAETKRQPVRKLDDRDVELLQPYADEIARVLHKKLRGVGFTGGEISTIIEEVESKIVLAKTPHDALQTVIDGIVGKRGIEMGHIRIIKGTVMELAAGKGFYSEHANKEIRTDIPWSSSRRVAKTGLPLIVNRRPDLRIEESVAKMPSPLKQEMDKMKSFGVFPLKALDNVEAVLSLYSTHEDVFSDQTLILCSRLAEIASYSLHDISIRAAATEKAKIEVVREAAASFAHRIGNILPVAQYRLRMIQCHPKVDRGMKADANKALQAVGRALEVAAGFRKYASHGTQEMARWPLAELLEQIVGYCRSQHPRLKISLEYQYKAVSKVVFDADPEILKDVFLSFVVDSVRFHPDGAPTVTVACRLRGYPGPNTQAVITYTDDGPGIRKDLKRKVFEPFYTTSDTGTGIGLTDAQAIIRAHGGKLREIGTPGKGVKFEILFPVRGT